jgi:pimeloyl-ACP methyl ester carboxylesterase
MITGLAALALAVPLALTGATEVKTATCAAPIPSTTQPGYVVADPRCEIDGTPFAALPGAKVFTGIKAGAAYRIEVPQHWNGRLVVYAHGYRGTGTTVYVDNPALRAHYVADGFAWAASSYATNGYDVGQGVRDSYALVGLFRQVTGLRTRDALMTGASMGGQVTAVMIEKHPSTFSGAMPMCGVLGDTSLFDYFLDADTTAAALAGVKIGFPLHPADSYQDQWRAQVAQILPALGVTAGKPPTLTATGKTWSEVVERRTGGVRPGFDGAFAYWNTATSLEPLQDLPFLFGLYPGLTGGTENIAAGNVSGNQFTVYRSTDGFWPTASEWKLNVSVLRVHPTTPPSGNLDGVPHVYGRPTIPVLSMHDVGDLFVPFSMEQIYAQRVAANGRSGLFVSRAIRGVGHCDFTQAEIAQGFDDLVHWVDTGKRPAGDAILDRRTVASPAFGCRFTNGTHPFFVAPACP